MAAPDNANKAVEIAAKCLLKPDFRLRPHAANAARHLGDCCLPLSALLMEGQTKAKQLRKALDSVSLGTDKQ